MIRRMTLLAAALIAVLVVVAAPAGAQDDDYAAPDATAQPQSDGTIVLSGENCPPSAPVDWNVREGNPQEDGAVVGSGQTTSNEDGAFTDTAGPFRNGRYTVSITCDADTTVLAVTVSRGRGVGGGQGGGQEGNRGQGAGGASLPRTGSDSSVPLARLGVVLVAAGGVALYGARKRNGRRAAFISA